MPKKRKRKYRGKFFEYFPGGNFVSEPFMNPKQCTPNTIRTKATKGANIIFCCTRPNVAVCSTKVEAPGKCWCENPAGKRVGSRTQSIHHRVKDFKRKYRGAWNRIQRVRVDPRTGSKTVPIK